MARSGGGGCGVAGWGCDSGGEVRDRAGRSRTDRGRDRKGPASMDHRAQHISGEQSILLTPWTHRQPQGEEFPDLAPGLVMSTFHSRPVWGGMAWRQAFPGRADQSAPARRMVGQLLADTGWREDAEWVTAELIANALQHSCSGQARGFFVVEVLRGAGVVRIVVYDLGGGSVPDFSRTPGSVPGSAEHGRGLAGVAELAVRLGVAGDASTGHAVWAELALTGEAIAASAASAAAAVGDAAGAGAGGSGLGGWHMPMPVAVGRATEEAGGVVACSGLSPVGCEGVSGEELGGLVGGLAVSTGGPGSDRGEGGCWPGPFRALAGGVLGQGVGQVSAFGQEPWARQALAGLREDWPDWAFLVVRYRWLAMRGKQVVISAAGPQELRQALPSIPPKPNSTRPSSTEPSLAGSSPGETEMVPVLRAVAGLPSAEPGVGWTGMIGPPPPAPALMRGTGGGGASGGAGTGLSGAVAGVAPLSGMLAAEWSVTGMRTVAGADGARVAWWQGGWWPWGWRRDRSWPGSRARADARPVRRAGPVDGGRRRHRRARSRPSAEAAAIAA
ncbi:ATP-binding protein [Nonomuraea sp. NPDC046802]|uniref:ATP-binding protein n=1 Tax=Nonomuraea sp. NPDC046802 TaxID=3154919 RepID=UPI0033C97840